MNGFNRHTGLRYRCSGCGSGYHLAPKCPWRDALRSELGSASKERGKARNPPYSAISIETPIPASMTERPECEETKNEHAQYLSIAVDAERLFLASVSGSAAVLETSDTANLVRFRWLERHSHIWEQKGFQKILTHPSSARFRKGDDLSVARLRRISRGVSRKARATLLRFCWISTCRRHCVRAPRSHPVGDWISNVICGLCANKGRIPPWM